MVYVGSAAQAACLRSRTSEQQQAYHCHRARAVQISNKLSVWRALMPNSFAKFCSERLLKLARAASGSIDIPQADRNTRI